VQEAHWQPPATQSLSSPAGLPVVRMVSESGNLKKKLRHMMPLAFKFRRRRRISTRSLTLLLPEPGLGASSGCAGGAVLVL
jgi:hypothetical protein